MKLNIPIYQMGKERSEKYVLLLCKELNLPIKTKNDLRRNTLTDIDLQAEIEYTRNNGRAYVLQSMLDSKDRFLNSPISIGILNPTGMKTKLETKYGSHTASVTSSGYIEAPEISFSDDISFYRKLAVDEFNSKNLSNFSRAYRGYLQSCISLVECFLHRYTFHIKEIIPSTKDYVNTATLDSITSFDNRMEAWITTFATHKLNVYKKSKYRSKFIELKQERNKIVHPSKPTLQYSTKDVVHYLNYAKDGVGNFLSELRNYTEATENIGFISQIKNQADITILKKE